jgi:uncharacterized protein (TIGR00290 family)
LSKKKVIFSWSGGKDSTLCLHHLLQNNEFEVCYLLTSINGNNKRVSLHGIHQTLIEEQSKSIGIPLKIVYVFEGNNEEYEKQMREVLMQVKSEGIDTVVFGDIFLEDLRKYREDNLFKIGMNAFFPLWKMNTMQLVLEFIELNYKTVLCCINDAYLTKNDVGREITNLLIDNLPLDVDACGENGEYHTFCYSGPIFKKPIKIILGKKIYKPLESKFQTPDCNNKITTGFWFNEIELKK